MNQPAPIRSRTWAQGLTALLGLLLTIAVITQLRVSAPHRQLDIQVRPPAESPGSTSRDEVTCRRRTADGATTDEPVDLTGVVTSTRVTECPAVFDQRRITFVGEVIGDVLRRDGGAWVLINDDDYALVHGPLPTHQNFGGGNTGLAVWLPDPHVELIDAPGGPDRRGTILRIEGVVHRVDPADGGGLTLRADTVERLAAALPLPHPLHHAQLVVAGLAALIAIGAVVAERQVTRRR